MTDPQHQSTLDASDLVGLCVQLGSLHSRVSSRVTAMVERDGSVDAAVTGRGIGISYLLASEIARALLRAEQAIRQLSPPPGPRNPLIPIPRDARAGKEPCGECHIKPGETCDICGARRPE